MLVAAVRQVAQTGDFEAAFETPAVDEAQTRTHAFDVENCRWAKVDVSSKEPHELLLFRVNDG